MPPDPLEEEHASHALSALRTLYSRQCTHASVLTSGYTQPPQLFTPSSTTAFTLILSVTIVNMVCFQHLLPTQLKGYNVCHLQSNGVSPIKYTISRNLPSQFY